LAEHRHVKAASESLEQIIEIALENIQRMLHLALSTPQA
jgi:hypothetical protein